MPFGMRGWFQEVGGGILIVLVLAAHPGEPHGQLRRCSGQVPVSLRRPPLFSPPILVQLDRDRWISIEP
jgi:hypothetical protein